MCGSREVKKNSKIFGLNNWKGKVAINYNGESLQVDKFVGDDQMFNSGCVNFETCIKWRCSVGE